MHDSIQHNEYNENTLIALMLHYVKRSLIRVKYTLFGNDNKRKNYDLFLYHN